MNRNLKFGVLIFVVIALLIGAILYFNSKNSPKEVPKDIPKEEEVVDNTPEPVKEESPNKVCEWLNNPDIFIKVNIPEGIEKENTYEVGFYFNPAISNMRLARKECDYVTGFTFAELKGKKAADVGVRNYSDSVRRVLVGEPIDVTFDSNGVPSIGTNIEVTILR